MKRLLGLLILLGWSVAASAQVPTASSGCGLGGSWAGANIAAFTACLNSAVPKSDWENFALATAGNVIWPGNPSAQANARSWETVISNDLLGSYGGVTETGVANTYAWWHLTINDGYAGGSPGYVNAGFRVDTNVGSQVTDYPWGILSVINTSSPTAQAAAVYGQANNSGSGPAFAGVFEAHATAGGTAVGVESDAGCTAGGNCVGFDAVQPAGQIMTAAYRAPCGLPALVSPTDMTSYIVFPCSGGVQVVSHGHVAATW